MQRCGDAPDGYNVPKSERGRQAGSGEPSIDILVIYGAAALDDAGVADGAANKQPETPVPIQIAGYISHRRSVPAAFAEDRP
jgi:hypothetical protein